MFNEAFLNAEPQPVIVDAPVQCPPPVSSLIGERHMTFFHHQFTSPPLVVFDPSPQIDTALTAKFLSVVRERMGRTSDLLGIENNPYLLLDKTAWIMFDSRGCPGVPTTDPIAAGVPRLTSMAVFQVRAKPINPALPIAADNVLWQAKLITNRIRANGDRPALVIPDNILLSLTKIKRGYSPFSTCREIFTDLHWPEDIVFLERGSNGKPVSPVTLAAPLVASNILSNHRNDVTFAGGGHADDLRIARESQIKEATKDHMTLRRIAGLYEEHAANALFGSGDYRTLTGAKDAICEIVARTVNELSIGETQAERFLLVKFGSNHGVTTTDRISVTLFAQRKTSPTKNVLDFTIMFNRFRDCAAAVFGSVARLALDALFVTLSDAIYPTIGDNPHSARISPNFAVDIVNDAMYQVGHNADLCTLTLAERWMPPMVNVMNTPVWQTAIQLQAVHMMEQIASEQMASIKRKPGTAIVNPNPKKLRGGKNNGAALQGVATKSSPDPPRCTQQDKPDGCSYGLRCRFTHDADNPKTDDTRTKKSNK